MKTFSGEHHSKSLKDTKLLAYDFVRELKSGNVVALYGELGAGKTAFVQFVGEALGIKKRIISPTFILMRSYDISDKRFSKLIHLDLYRTNSADELESIDLQEIMADKNNLVFIEWAEKAKDVLPSRRINIRISYEGKDQRIFSLEELS